MNVQLTQASRDLLNRLRNSDTVQDFLSDDPTAQWVSCPLFADELSAVDKGNLTDLKKKGLVSASSDVDRISAGEVRWVELDMTTEVVA
jgi:hypothetical protein